MHPPAPNGLPLEDKTIADQLKAVGYSTHMVGKWHIGFYKKEYTPTYRGFDSFFGKNIYSFNVVGIEQTSKWTTFQGQQSAATTGTANV